ncbi:MAG TPA: prenyltransferase/squalene oxidase repeat-containing protein [Chthoniobacter sp.]|nr:prenyltransferase/squalene oxidase repeat-containing protein [Chthoniobacter sp.]
MYTPEEKKSFMVRLQERMAASRFLTFSALLHAILIFLGGGVVLYKQATDTPDFAASGGDLVASDTQVQAPPEQPPDLTQQEFTPQTPQLTAPQLSAITTNNVSTPQFQVAQALPATMSAPTNDVTKALASATKAMGKGVSGGIPGTMASRVGGTARNMAMQMNGGKKESEEAVLRGLRWLVKTQNPDGSWGKGGGNPTIAAMTGFSILSFLGHGETPVSAEFGPTVQKALDWVLKNGQANDARLSMEKTFSQPGVYAHAIVAYALGEYYTMTKDERVIELLKKAVGYVVEGQGPDGGWMYAYDKTESDTSVSGWQIQALKAAHLSGLDIAGVDGALDKAMLNLQRVRGKNGGFGYRNAASEKYSLTGVGVLCTYFWKQEKDKMVREGIEYIIDHTTKPQLKDQYFPVEYKGDKADLYAWYYNTQACLMVGGAAWNTWNRLFQGELVKNQAPDGSWPPMAGKSVGDFQKSVEGNGPFYRTNFCILMLEVYYRYMPTTK